MKTFDVIYYMYITPTRIEFQHYQVKAESKDNAKKNSQKLFKQEFGLDPKKHLFGCNER